MNDDQEFQNWLDCELGKGLFQIRISAIPGATIADIKREILLSEKAISDDLFKNPEFLKE